MRRGDPSHQARSSSRGGLAPIPITGFILQEDGFYLLQEDGSKLIYSVYARLAQEDDFPLLQEDGSKIYV